MGDPTENTQTFLAPPVLAAIRNEEIAARVKMERTVSQEIREEREDLKEAAEQSLNVIVDIGLDGIVRWVSPSWKDVVGTPVEAVQGKPITDVFLEDEECGTFRDTVESMKEDDSRSQTVRFRVRLGPSSHFSHDTAMLAAQREAEGFRQDEAQEDEQVQTITLEGQGIMVYDVSTGGESHVGFLHLAAISSNNNAIDHVDAATINRTQGNHNRST